MARNEDRLRYPSEKLTVDNKPKMVENTLLSAGTIMYGKPNRAVESIRW